MIERPVGSTLVDQPDPARRRGGGLLLLSVSSLFLLAVFVTVPTISAGVKFKDVSASVGIEDDLYESPTFHSLGVNWVDFNVDGWPDLFVVNGYGGQAALYRNDGTGGFTKVNHLLPDLPNLDLSGSIFADYDNDGDPDIYIYTDNEQFELEGTNDPDGPPNLLLKNLWQERGIVPGEPLFVDVAATAGVDDLAPSPLGDYPGMRAKTAAWLDYDLDGCVDLFVGHMVLQKDGRASNRDRLFRNRCDGTFSDVTLEAGLYQTLAPEHSTYRPTLAVVGGHLNGDRYPDLYIVQVSPGIPGRYRPEGHIDRILYGTSRGVFEEQEFAGVGDDAQAGMGIDFADIDLDGDIDIYISDLWEHKYELESPPPYGNPLYLNEGDALQENSAGAAGVQGGSSWGVNFFDADADGDEDLFVGTTGEFAGRSYLYTNNGDGTFHDVSQIAKIDTGQVRGSAVADYDGDGDLDLALVNEDGPLQLFRNDSTNLGNWLEVRLTSTLSNRSAIGAIVLIRTDGQVQRREVKGGSSTHSQDDLVVHFGLDRAVEVDRLVVLWPSRQVSVLRNLPVNELIEVLEDSGSE